MNRFIRSTVAPQEGSFTAATFQSQGGTSNAYKPISGGTNPGGQVVQPVPMVPSGAVAWLHSPAAAPYQGRWVALDPAGSVVADADSPADFPDAIMQDPSVAIFYVVPAGVKLIC